MACQSNMPSFKSLTQLSSRKNMHAFIDHTKCLLSPNHAGGKLKLQATCDALYVLRGQGAFGRLYSSSGGGYNPYIQ